MRLHAAQHVFGSLTKNQSVARLHGYQTLFYTQGLLTETEVEMIERRAQFHATSDERIKWQFYRLSEEKAVISCLSPIAEPDEFGRKGRYLAHSLVLYTSDLARLGGAPFDLMRTNFFYTTIEKALADGNLQASELPATTLDIEPVWLDNALAIADEWDGETLGKLVRLICQARSLAEQNKYVALIGSNEQVLNAVSIAFALAAPEALRSCSFDTSASGCDWTRDATFLLRGFADERDARTQFVIDTARRRVKLADLTNVRLSPYERWIESAMRAKSFRDLLGDQERAQALTAILKGEPADLTSLREISDEFTNDFAQANAELIEERIKSFLPASLSQPLQDAVLLRAGSSVVERLRWLMKNMHGDRINEVIYQTLLHDCAQPPVASDLRAIKPLANDHSGIGLLLASWLKEEQLRRENLVAMRPDEYGARVKELQLRADFAAWQVFSPTHLSSWFDLCRSSFEFEDITKGLSSVAEFGNSWECKRTATVVEELKPEELQKLWRWLQSSRYDLPELQAELEYALGIQPQQNSFQSRFNLLSWFKSGQSGTRRARRAPPNKSQMWKPILIILAVLLGAALGLWLFRESQPGSVDDPTTTKVKDRQSKDRRVALSKEAEMYDKPNGRPIRVLSPGTRVTAIDTPKTFGATKWIKIHIEEVEDSSPTQTNMQKKDKGNSQKQKRETQPVGWIKEESLKP